MKFKVIIILPIVLIVINGCVTQETREDSITEEDMKFVEVKEQEAGNYFISLAGSPKISLDQARELWHQKASELCGNTEYQSSFSKNLMWQGDMELAEPGLNEGGVYGATGTLCATGGAIGCMLASIFQGFSGGGNMPKFPVVEGNIDCSAM
ncbi:MAG: hypothetical protein AAGB35_03810 [Pseudomonadota bacterium]